MAIISISPIHEVLIAIRGLSGGRACGFIEGHIGAEFSPTRAN